MKTLEQARKARAQHSRDKHKVNKLIAEMGEHILRHEAEGNTSQRTLVQRWQKVLTSLVQKGATLS